MAGMLLCLSRDQRMVYVLGEVFEADHNVGAELLEISKDNFRKKLERARKNLYQFMNQKCGLIRKENPCRCARKTKGFIKAGWVDPEKLKFNTDYTQKIATTIREKNQALDQLYSEDYAAIFKETPFYEKAHAKRLMDKLFEDQRLKDTFNLN